MFKSHALPTQSDNHDYFTRNRNDLMIPRFHRSKTQATIFYRGIIFWNNLPGHIKTLQSSASFKNAVKHMIIEDYLLS